MYWEAELYVVTGKGKGVGGAIGKCLSSNKNKEHQRCVFLIWTPHSSLLIIKYTHDKVISKLDLHLLLVG